MILVHCCVHGQAPKYLCELFQTNRNFGQRVTHWKEKLYIVPVHTNFENNGHLLQRGASMEYIIKFFRAKQFHFYSICITYHVFVCYCAAYFYVGSCPVLLVLLILFFIVSLLLMCRTFRKTSLWLREH